MWRWFLGLTPNLVGTSHSLTHCGIGGTCNWLAVSEKSSTSQGWGHNGAHVVEGIQVCQIAPQNISQRIPNPDLPVLAGEAPVHPGLLHVMCSTEAWCLLAWGWLSLTRVSSCPLTPFRQAMRRLLFVSIVGKAQHPIEFCAKPAGGISSEKRLSCSLLRALAH